MLARPEGLYMIATQSPNVVTASDELFFALDKTTLDIEGETWNVEVCGIFSEGAEHWIQANLHGFVTYSVTLRASALDAAEIRKTLSAWLPYATFLVEDPSERVVSVATA